MTCFQLFIKYILYSSFLNIIGNKITFTLCVCVCVCVKFNHKSCGFLYIAFYILQISILENVI